MAEFDRYAVFGHPISHSKSPLIHTLFAEQTGQTNFEYTAQDVSADEFEEAVRDFFSKGGKGLNCTVPLKELAWQLSEVNTERVEISKAVNTLRIEKGIIYGDNTDGIGLVNDLLANLKIEIHGKRILLLGAGGASRGILKPLQDEKPASVVIANRTLAKAYQLANEFSKFGSIDSMGFNELKGQTFDLIINATAASLTDEIPPLPDDVVDRTGCCYDLAYGLQPTAFVNWGIQHNVANSFDGLGMLVEQAAEAFNVWRGVRPATAPVIAKLNSDRLS